MSFLLLLFCLNERREQVIGVTCVYIALIEMPPQLLPDSYNDLILSLGIPIDILKGFLIFILKFIEFFFNIFYLKIRMRRRYKRSL